MITSTGINPNKNYERISNGHVHTGQQIINLLELATPKMQAIILLDIWMTDKEANYPNDKYGIPI